MSLSFHGDLIIEHEIHIEAPHVDHEKSSKKSK